MHPPKPIMVYELLTLLLAAKHAKVQHLDQTHGKAARTLNERPMPFAAAKGRLD
jgi:hypothetical protein